MNIFRKIKQLFTNHKPIFTVEDELLFVIKLKLGYDDPYMKITSYKKDKTHYIVTINNYKVFTIPINEIYSKS